MNQPGATTGLRTSKRSTAHDVSVLCLVSLPPPVTGRTIATRRFLRRLETRTRLSVRNLSAAGARWAPARVVKTCKSMAWVIAMALGAARHRDYVYIVANHGLGLWFDIAYAAMARLWGVPVIVHHHVFSYFNQRSRRLALLFRLTDASGFHLLLCNAMKRSAASLYSTTASLRVMPNFGPDHVGERAAGTAGEQGSLTRLLFLSNLTIDKGVDTVLELAESLAGRDDIIVELAGPAMDADVARAIERCRVRCGPGLIWHGPVDAEQRTRLLGQTDLFLFPTRYRNEAQPLVLIEALEAAVPVLSNRRGCIADMLREGQGEFLTEDAQFVSRAGAMVNRMSSEPGYKQVLSERALACARSLEKRSQEGLRDLVEALSVAKEPKP